MPMKSFPLNKAFIFLEPGPVILVSTAAEHLVIMENHMKHVVEDFTKNPHELILWWRIPPFYYFFDNPTSSINL
jgi:hypothetical protein